MMNENEQENEKRETPADIAAEMRQGMNPNGTVECQYLESDICTLSDRIEIAAKQDEILMLLLMLYAVEDYEESWATNEYKWCVRKCCERLGIEYQPTGRLLQDRIGEKIGKKIEGEKGDKNGKSE